MDYKDTLRHWLFAIGATIVYMAASGVGIFLWAFFFLPVLTGRIATPEESLAWWFGLYFITMCAIMGYIWKQELSLEPTLRRDGTCYVGFLFMPVILWLCMPDEPQFLFGTLGFILMLALSEGRQSYEQMKQVCTPQALQEG